MKHFKSLALFVVIAALAVVVIAPAAFTEWIDYGPPGTVSAPSVAGNRFYRVFLNP